MHHIALVDDDQDIRELLSTYLQRNQFRVTAFADGELFQAHASEPFDAVILDIGLPGIDGLSLCKNLRKHSQIPVLMLTAADDDIDRILGLEIGADDYMGKPFNPRELLARIRALLRRSQHASPARPDALHIDAAQRQALWNGQALALTGLEFELLSVLAGERGQVVSRDELGRATKGRRPNPLDRSLDTAVSRLRQKLNDAGAVGVLRAVRGRGYVLVGAEHD